MDTFLTIIKPTAAEFKDRGSTFLAFATPITTVAGFKEQLRLIKKQHPKAVHHCFAYRLGTDGNLFRTSDDGEPAGTAGKPILGQIDSKQITNVAVVVARYFGGNLLGIPGLIQAYKTTAALALQLTPIIEQPIQIGLQMEFNYAQINEEMMLVKQHACSITNQTLGLFCEVKLGVCKSQLPLLLQKCTQIQIAIKPLP